MAESNPSGLALGTLRDLPPTAQLIGEFIVRWSLAEGALIMPLLVAMNSKDQQVAAAMLASTNSTEGKLKLVRIAVAHIKQPQHQILKKTILDSLNKLQKLCEERNALCHHLWAFRSSDRVSVTVDYRKGDSDKDRVTVRSEEYLRGLCNRVVEAAYAICAATGSPWITEDTVREYKL